MAIEETVRARLRGSGYRTEITARSHVLVADEPMKLGGTDAGPAPYEFLLASLGACTSITLRMYASRKSWPLAGLDVDLALVTEGEARRIDRRITLHGDLDATQRERLLEIANSCPVHKLLTGAIDIQSRLTEEP